MPRGAAAGSLAATMSAHRLCTRCVVAGHLERAHPVFSGSAGQRILLVGQAPGIVEDDVTRPFAGRAGAQLMRWFSRAGFEGEDDVRRRVFMTAMTTCFPGRVPGGGDRRPSAREVALCRPWLDAYLRLLAPALVIAVGGLAHERFLGRGRRLEAVVGRAWAADGTVARELEEPVWPLILPLPHPSGQSRWLNDAANAARLERALGLLATLAPRAEHTTAARLRTRVEAVL